ncbi:sulfotransferase family protein [Alteraurantiacibacter aquimixticola]|uniref:sulfotransferase family protein n=1 Tax=Alteraurantiacibacter aquimixticola TaxID=2489173 RepID=UPI00145BCD72|nr:sulfotransferase [Alteraurantiacibacter aquimixticola]
MATVPPRPHLLARSRTAEWADRVIEGIWDKGLHPQPPLEPDALWEIGAKGFSEEDERFGRSEEDVADFRLRLEKLCEALREEAELNSLGHTMAYGQITSAIRVRHDLGRLWQRKPGIERTPIAPPIIVVGQMRAGTTRMHRLLAADPAHAGTCLYHGMNPVRPFPDIRPIKTRLGLAIARQINPWIDTLHPFGALRVDEELPWLSHALSPVALEAQYRIPSYVAFSEARDATPIYREFERMLRTDAAMMRNTALPRVLKCPQYAEDLAPLLARFPDARVVVTRRNSVEVLASTVSVVSCQMAYQTESADLSVIEAEWTRKLALREERMTAALAPVAGPVAEVDFDALSADWESEIARVYALLELDFTAAAHAAMCAEQRRAAKGRHTAHQADYSELTAK